MFNSFSSFENQYKSIFSAKKIFFNKLIFLFSEIVFYKKKEEDTVNKLKIYKKIA